MSVRQIDVPARARVLSSLTRIDYADTFVVELPSVGERTAEQWARRTLEGAPAQVRAQLVSGWRSLGLKVGRGGSGVLGWTVRTNTDDVLLVGAGSWIGMPGELLFKREREQLLFATFVRQGNPVAGAVWRRVERVHVATVRRLLERLLKD